MHEKMLKLLLDTKLRLSSRQLPQKAYSQFRSTNKEYDWFEEDFYTKYNSVDYNNMKKVLYKRIFNIGKISKTLLKSIPFQPPKHECHLFECSNKENHVQWCLCTKKVPLLHGNHSDESDDEDVNEDDYLGPVNSADELENDSEDEVLEDAEEMNPEPVYDKGDIRSFFMKHNKAKENHLTITATQDENGNVETVQKHTKELVVDENGFYEVEFNTGF